MNYETLNKNLDEIFELLKKAAPNHPVFQGGKFAIMTGEDPIWPVHAGWEGQNDRLVQQLEQLKREGHIAHYEPAKGMYNLPENSYLIHNPNFEKIKEVAHKLGQESLILSNNGRHQMAFTNGPNINKAHPQGTENGKNLPVIEHTTKPDNFYTETYERPTSHKKVIFTIPLDFDNLTNVKGKELGGDGIIKKSDHQLEWHFDTTQFVTPHSDKPLSVLKAFRRQHANNTRN